MVGAQSQIGRYLVKGLVESEQHQIKVLVHNAAQSAYFDAFGISSFVLQSNQSLKPFVQWISPIDAVVFAGSVEMEDREASVLLEIDFTIRLMEAIEAANGRRIIYVSTIDSRKGKWASFPDYYQPLLVKNRHVVQWIKNSNLTYTILQTGTLTDCKGTGLIKIAEMDADKGEIPREDVAKVIQYCIEKNTAIKMEVKIISGKLPIASALNESRISSSR